MKLLISCLLLALAVPALAQEDYNFNVGDTLVIGKCSGKNFQYIDQYVKTRIEPGELPYNKETGEGFYKFFFSSGDFDAKKLPASFSGKKAVIVCFQDVEDNTTKEVRTIVLASYKDVYHIIWIEMQQALENGEISKQH